MEPSFDEMTKAERILYVQDLWDRIAADPELYWPSVNRTACGDHNGRVAVVARDS